MHQERAKVSRMHPNRAYASSINSEIYDLNQRLKHLQNKKVIAAMLINFTRDQLHDLVAETSTEAEEFAMRY